MGQKHRWELLKIGRPSTLKFISIEISLSSFENTIFRLFSIPLNQYWPTAETILTDFGVRCKVLKSVGRFRTPEELKNIKVVKKTQLN